MGEVIGRMVNHYCVSLMFGAGNTGLYQDWMVPLLQLVAFLLRTTMCLLSQHLQTSSIYLMLKLGNWENGQCSILLLFPEDTKNFLGRLLAYLSPPHPPPIHQNHHRLLFIVPGAVLILCVLPCCNSLTLLLSCICILLYSLVLCFFYVLS